MPSLFEFIMDEYRQLSLDQTHWRNRRWNFHFVRIRIIGKINGLMLGGITGVRPTEVVVLGAGIVGEFARKQPSV